MRAIAILTASLLVGLTACGGGGGSTSTPPPEPPSLSIASTAPTTGTTAVNADSGTLSISLRVHGYSNPSAIYGLNCGTDNIPLTGTPQWNASQERYEIAAGYTDLPGSSNCEFSGQLNVDTPLGSTPNSLGWSVKFTTAVTPPLRYGPTLVGLVGGKFFAMTVSKPYAMRIEPAKPRLESGRAAPTPVLVGTALTPSGRIPVGLEGHGASGPFAVIGRFNPVTATSTGTLNADPFPANHSFTGSAGSFSYASGWLLNVGGVGPAPTATATIWASDGSGGWFYVEAAAQDTLLQRDATGAITQVHREAGSTFAVLRLFSN